MRLISDPGLQSRAHLAIDDARTEVARARCALGHAVFYAGLVARIAWVDLVVNLAALDRERFHGGLYRRLMSVHPEVPIARIARLLRGCNCDSRDPATCSGRADDRWDDQRHTWCSCVACHGPAVAAPGARAAQQQGGKGGAA